jgi:hypothetical protein
MRARCMLGEHTRSITIIILRSLVGVVLYDKVS